MNTSVREPDDDCASQRGRASGREWRIGSEPRVELLRSVGELRRHLFRGPLETVAHLLLGQRLFLREEPPSEHADNGADEDHQADGGRDDAIGASRC